MGRTERQTRARVDGVLEAIREQVGAASAIAFRLYARGDLLVLDEPQLIGASYTPNLEARLHGLALPPTTSRSVLGGGLGIDVFVPLATGAFAASIPEPRGWGIALHTAQDLIGGVALFGDERLSPRRLSMRAQRELLELLQQGLASDRFLLTCDAEGLPINPTPTAEAWLDGYPGRTERVFETALRGGILGGAKLQLMHVQPGVSRLSMVLVEPIRHEPLPASMLLTDTQQHVARHLAQGGPQNDDTRAHRDATFRRLGVRSRIELARVLGRPIGKWFQD